MNPTCPIGGCGKRLAERQILCRFHWDQVPPKLQAPIQALKKQRGSPEWSEAVRVAVSDIATREALRREYSTPSE